MDIDLTNPQDATGAANTPELTKEFIPSLGVTEIPDFETFSLDPDKYLSQVIDPNTESMEPSAVEEAPMQTQVQTETLPPVEGTETQAQTQVDPNASDMPSVPAAGAQEGSGETSTETDKETLQ